MPFTSEATFDHGTRCDCIVPQFMQAAAFPCLCYSQRIGISHNRVSTVPPQQQSIPHMWRAKLAPLSNIVMADACSSAQSMAGGPGCSCFAGRTWSIHDPGSATPGAHGALQPGDADAVCSRLACKRTTWAHFSPHRPVCTITARWQQTRCVTHSQAQYLWHQCLLPVVQPVGSWF